MVRTSGEGEEGGLFSSSLLALLLTSGELLLRQEHGGSVCVVLRSGGRRRGCLGREREGLVYGVCGRDWEKCSVGEEFI